MSAVTFKQKTLTSSFRVDLEDGSLDYSFSEVLTTKKRVPYDRITGLFRDRERCYLVWDGEVLQLLHEPRRKEYVDFLQELIRRMKASRGA